MLAFSESKSLFFEGKDADVKTTRAGKHVVPELMVGGDAGKGCSGTETRANPGVEKLKTFCDKSNCSSCGFLTAFSLAKRFSGRFSNKRTRVHAWPLFDFRRSEIWTLKQADATILENVQPDRHAQ